MGDQKAIELYTRFREARRPLGHKHTIVAYHDFFDQSTYLGISMPFVEIAKEQTREIANAVNEFGHYLHDLAAWNSILELLTEDEKFEVTFEFVLPTSLYCLGAPYSIKGRLHTSIAETAHQANRFQSGWKDDASLKRPDYYTAQRHAQHWTSWPALDTILSKLNAADFTTATDDFRNRFNHGYPRRIEFGLTGFVRRNVVHSDKSVSYGFGFSPPLRIADLIPLLGEQHVVAAQCYDMYINLIKEQHAQLPTNPASQGTSKNGRS